MRKTSTFAIVLTILLLAVSALVAASSKVGYQGRLTDAAGNQVDSFFDITYRLYSSPTGGTILWQETQGVTVRAGLFSVELGTNTPLDLTLLPTRPDSLYLEIQVGSDVPLSPRTRLTTSPMSAVALSVRGDVTTSPGALTILDDDSDGDGIPTTMELRVDSSGAVRQMEAHIAGASAKGIDKCSPKLAEAAVTYDDGTGTDSTAVRMSSGVDKARLYMFGGNSVSATGTPDSAGAELQMRAFGWESSIAVETEGVGIVFIDTSGDTTLTLRADSGGTGFFMNKADLIEQISVESSLRVRRRTTGMSIINNMRAVAPSGVASEVRMIVDTAETKLTLSKADAKRALEALTSHRSVSLTIIDSTLNDSSLIELSVDTSGNNGIAVRAAKKVAKFKAGAALASTVNRPAGTGGKGAYLDLTGELDRYVEIVVDSVRSSLTFSDTLGTSTVVLQDDGAGNGRIVVISNNTALGLPPSSVEVADLNSDGKVDLRVDGNLSIGLASPTNILEVVQGSATDPIADAWTTYSSRRWKKDIQPIVGALGKIERLRGVTYNWKETGKHDIGLIAEEVGMVIPEIVAYEENGIDARSVDYARLVALLIEGMKEQQITIESMQVEMAELRTIVTKLAEQGSTKENSSYGMK